MYRIHGDSHGETSVTAGEVAVVDRPTAAVACVISASGSDVRVTLDATEPTATHGLPLQAGAALSLPVAASIRATCVEVGTHAHLDVLWISGDARPRA